MPRYLPFRPESVEKLKGRYHLALDPPNDVESVEIGVCLPPEEQRRNLFDFDDGLRMVISYDVHEDGKKAIHLAAFMLNGSELQDRLRLENGGLDTETYLRDVILRFRLLSQYRKRVEWLGFLEDTSAHWEVIDKCGYSLSN
jgi:hypothetical protein